MAERKPFSGTIEIDGSSYPFRGEYGRMDEPGARLGWTAEVDGVGLPPSSRQVAIPAGYQGINARAVTIFVQDHFQGLARLRAFEARNHLAK